ncbi:MAG TPA: hypothetical protein VNK92_07430 [Vicinamibacterales bacterium]|jgi:uncharacterized protein YjeT (DUF2065 family)|nr:hypothetical protein [Vicinamibacterales bacterium]
MRQLTTAWWTLRLAIGLMALLAGLDKFLELLADWDMYLSPLAASLLPVSAAAFMRIVGIVEMAAGALVLAGRTRPGGYLVAIWLLGVAANLLATGLFYDLAARDVVLALSAFALAEIGEARRAFAEGSATASGRPQAA